MISPRIQPNAPAPPTPAHAPALRAALPPSAGTAYLDANNCLHEGLQLADDGLFQLGLTKLIRLRYAQELQHVRVFDEVLGRWFEWLRFDAHLCRDHLLVPACG